MTEAAHYIMLTFCQKDKSLQHLAYITHNNRGLLQTNMTRMQARNPGYHWYLEMFKRLNLPVMVGITNAVEHANKIRSYHLEKKASEKHRITLKIGRAERQEGRKAWVKAQLLVHTYGSDSEDSDDNKGRTGQDDAGREEIMLAMTHRQVCPVRHAGVGSTSHRCTSHRACPLNKSSVQDKENKPPVPEM